MPAALRKAASSAGDAEVKVLVKELKNGSQEDRAGAARMLGAIAAREPPPSAPGASNLSSSSSSSMEPGATTMLVRCGAVPPLVAIVAAHAAIS